MSEKTEIAPLQITAFVLAMIGGPMFVTACTFWLAFVPVYAVVIGGIPYLMIGTPMALWMALTGPVTVERSLQWSGLTILSMTIVAATFVAITEGTEGLGFVAIVGLVCLIFAMPWAAASGWIYGAMTNEKAV